jgi:hypothetical protein
MELQNYIKSIYFEKTVTFFKNMYIFAITVLLLLPIRTAQGSFSKDSFFTQDNTPPMPLNDAHLGGFLFL